MTLMATALYLLLDRDTGEVSFASAGHPPPLVIEREGQPRFLEGGAVGAARHGRPRVVHRRHGPDRARRDARALHRRPGRAPRHVAGRPPGPAGHGGARWPTASSATCATRCSRACSGAMRPADDVAVLARAARARAAGQVAGCACPPIPLRWPSCGSRLGRFLDAAGARLRGAIRDHPHRVRGRDERDRARLRSRRRGVRASRPVATGRGARHGARQRHAGASAAAERSRAAA